MPPSLPWPQPWGAPSSARVSPHHSPTHAVSQVPAPPLPACSLRTSLWSRSSGLAPHPRGVRMPVALPPQHSPALSQPQGPPVRHRPGCRGRGEGLLRQYMQGPAGLSGTQSAPLDGGGWPCSYYTCRINSPRACLAGGGACAHPPHTLPRFCTIRSQTEAPEPACMPGEPTLRSFLSPSESLRLAQPALLSGSLASQSSAGGSGDPLGPSCDSSSPTHRLCYLGQVTLPL